MRSSRIGSSCGHSGNRITTICLNSSRSWSTTNLRDIRASPMKTAESTLPTGWDRRNSMPWSSRKPAGSLGISTAETGIFRPKRSAISSTSVTSEEDTPARHSARSFKAPSTPECTGSMRNATRATPARGGFWKASGSGVKRISGKMCFSTGMKMASRCGRIHMCMPF